MKTPNSEHLPAPPEDGPDPVKELAHEWLDVMQSDPDYLEEALGDFPEILKAIFISLHEMSCLCDTPDCKLIGAKHLSSLTNVALEMYADAKAEAGEQLP